MKVRRGFRRFPMELMIQPTSVGLWQTVVKDAEDQCSIILKQEVETYLVTLLARYTNKPEIANQVFATTFLEALQSSENRMASLQHVGDGCLLFAGLFPRAAERKRVKVQYFV